MSHIPRRLTRSTNSLRDSNIQDLGLGNDDLLRQRQLDNECPPPPLPPMEPTPSQNGQLSIDTAADAMDTLTDNINDSQFNRFANSATRKDSTSTPNPSAKIEQPSYASNMAQNNLAMALDGSMLPTPQTDQPNRSQHNVPNNSHDGSRSNPFDTDAANTVVGRSNPVDGIDDPDVRAAHRMLNRLI